MNNSGDGEVRVKQEGDSAKIRSQWSLSHKNPRIVRVSRNFGGKDRHSKVCTVRGLRDRRIRLSVPTAVQLYDLQEKLGLSQPSKVVDWLLDATKADIDKLPPLPLIPGIFPNPNHHSSNDEIHQQEGFPPFVAQNFFPYFQWDHNHNTNPNLSLSQFGLPNQGEDLNPAAAAASNSHLYFCPNAPTTIPPFPSYLPPSMDHNPGFSTALHLMSSPLAFNVTSKPAHPRPGGSHKED